MPTGGQPSLSSYACSMGGIRIWRVAAVVAAILVLPVAAAPAQNEVPTSRLGGGAITPGVVSLGYYGKPGSTVFFYERVGNVLKHVGTLPIGPAGFIAFREAGVWRCDRPVRRYASVEVQPNGTKAFGSYDLRTGSCAQRFKLRAPARARRGGAVRVLAVDRWKLGDVRTQLCVTPPDGREACRRLTFPRAVDLASRRFRVTKRGQWRIQLKFRGHRLRTAITVGSGGSTHKSAPVVLATGDSTMGGIDHSLADRLGRTATVRSDVHPGTHISGSDEWITRATRQALRVKPRTTVISIGAGEGYPMETPGGSRVECCGKPWVIEYARRVKLMMKSYRQGGRGKQLWLALPATRSAGLNQITAQVNKAIMTAAAGRPGVKILRLDLVFTPQGYREVVRYRGQDVRVRSVDGVHLSAAGAALAADVAAQAIRKGW